MWRSTWRKNATTSSCPMLSQKNTPNRPSRFRVGLTEMPEITEILSLAKWWRIKGVQPTGAHVLLTVGVSIKPDSSMKIR